MKSCPLYKGGFCVSPRLPEPSNAYVNLRCVTEVIRKTCNLYEKKEDEEKEKEGLEQFESKVGQKVILGVKPSAIFLEKPLLPTYEHYSLFRDADGRYFAKCEILNRMASSLPKLSVVKFGTKPRKFVMMSRVTLVKRL